MNTFLSGAVRALSHPGHRSRVLSAGLALFSCALSARAQIADGDYAIVSRLSGKALDAVDFGTANGTRIVQWPYWGGVNQRWTLTSTGDGSYAITGIQSGRGLELINASAANGAALQLWDYFGGTHQKFTLTATGDGYYRITPTHATSGCLDVKDISTANGAPIQLWTYWGGTGQQWSFVSAPKKPGENPALRNTFTADPAPLVVGNTVYLYVGRDDAHGDQLFNMPEWLCYSSTDLKNWTAHGSVLKPTDFSWGVANSAWAGQVIQKNGLYYFFATVQNVQGGNAIGVAVSSSPTGPFVDARGTPLVTDDMTVGGPSWADDIDPTVFTDTDGTTWLGWGHGRFYLAKLAANMTSLDGDITSYVLPDYTEGPWLHRRGSLYYLTYASIDSVNGGSERLAYATSSSITGPWTYRGLLTDTARASYTIHPGIIEFGGQSYLFYHNCSLILNGEFGATGRRSVCVDYLSYNADGTMRWVNQTTEGLTLSPPSP